MCRRGASVIQKDVLEKIRGDNIAAYVVWLPVLNFQEPATLQKNAAEVARRIPDPRVRFYSDPKGHTGAAFGKLMNIPYGSPAWDIYFVFGADARWDGEPPKPDYWMHQLGGVDPNLRLDGPVFFEHVQKLLEQARPFSHRREPAPAVLRRVPAAAAATGHF